MLEKLRSKKKKGFNLIELLVVMLLIAILISLAAPRFLGYTKDAKVTAMMTDTKVIEQACYLQAMENDDNWPALLAAADGDVDDEALCVIAVELFKAELLGDDLGTLDPVTNVITLATGKTEDDLVAAVKEYSQIMKEIDEAKISNQIRSTGMPIEEFIIIDRASIADDELPDGYGDQLEGHVFAKNALTDRDGNWASGTVKGVSVVAEAATP